VQVGTSAAEAKVGRCMEVIWAGPGRVWGWNTLRITNLWQGYADVGVDARPRSFGETPHGIEEMRRIERLEDSRRTHAGLPTKPTPSADGDRDCNKLRRC
jgi:hypothetical protein